MTLESLGLPKSSRKAHRCKPGRQKGAYRHKTQLALIGLVVMSIQVQRTTVCGGSRPASLGRRQTPCSTLLHNQNDITALIRLYIAKVPNLVLDHAGLWMIVGSLLPPHMQGCP